MKRRSDARRSVASVVARLVRPPRLPAAARVAIVLLVVAITATVSLAEPAPDDDFALKLRVGRFDPASGVPEHLMTAMPRAPALSTTTPRGALHIVQFHSGPTAARQNQLQSHGVTVLDYLPEHALIVRLPTGASPQMLSSFPGVRAVVPFAWNLRRSPELGELAGAIDNPGPHEELRITAWLTDDAGADALAVLAARAFVGTSAASVRRGPPRRIQFAGPPATLLRLADALAQHPEVLFVDLARPNRLHNDRSVWIGQSYDRVAGPAESMAADPKPYSLSGTVFSHGITGTGQVIGVADTRLEHVMDFFYDPSNPVVKQTVDPPLPITVDPNHRKILAYNNAVSGADDPPYPAWRHGTHTSGSAAGDALANLSTSADEGHDTGDGMAPNAKLVYLDMYLGIAGNCTDFICAFCGIADILQQEYEAGARISTNSWGNSISEGNLADTAIWQRPDHLVMFSAGNDGAGNIDGIASAKNLLGVGATESYDAGFFDVFGILDPENVVNFSSGGPSPDGRYKPDIMAPGFGISSASYPPTYYSDINHPACDPGSLDVCFPTFGGCYRVDSSQTAGTAVLSGTSMAAPTAAGLAALARQYFADGFYPTGQAIPGDEFEPSAAMMKAVLLNSARNMTGRILSYNGSLSDRTDHGKLNDAPDNRQGWGRIMLDDALYFPGDARRLFVEDVASVAGEGLATGDARVYKVDVTSAAEPLKATLVWTDPPATSSSSQALRHDLDLIVTAPDDTVFKGNQFTADDPLVPGDKVSAPDPAGRDSVNNVEGVLIPEPQLGRYTFEITAANVPGYLGVFSQGYGVAITGEFTGAGDLCGIDPPPQNFTVIALGWNDVLLTWDAVPGATAYEIWRHSTDCSPPLTPERVSTVSGSETSFHDTSTQPGTLYHYTIRALLSPAVCRTLGSACVNVTTPPPPTVLTVSPQVGANNDPVQLTISGLDFQATPRVFLGTTLHPLKFELYDVTFISSTQIVAVAPVNLPPGTYHVSVRNPDGADGDRANAFTSAGPLQFPHGFVVDGWYLSSNVVRVNMNTFASVDGFSVSPSGAQTSNLNVRVATQAKGVFAHQYPVGLDYMGVFSPLTMQVTARFRPPSGIPRAMELSPDGSRAYVLSGGSPGAVDVLDLTTETWIGTVPLTGTAATGGLVVSPDGQRVYAHSSDVFYTPTDIVAIDTATLTSVGTIPGGSLPRDMTMTADSSRLYVPILWDAIVKEIDTATLTVIDTILISDPGCTTSCKPGSVVLSPDETVLYVATEAGVAKMDLATNNLLDFQPGNYFNISFDEVRNRVYVRNSVGIHALDPVTLDLIDTLDETAFNIERPGGVDVLEHEPLQLFTVTPGDGCSTGGSLITVSGGGFQGTVLDDSATIVQQGTRVLFGAAEATSATLMDSHTISVLAPPQSPGLVDVQLINPNGEVATLSAAFTYGSFCASLPEVRPVPNGLFGRGMKATRIDASGSVVLLDWDVDGCASPEYHVVYGDLGDVGSFNPLGASCSLGRSGIQYWSSVPTGNLWFLIVGDSGAGTEGSWGTDGDGNIRPGQTPNGTCFVTQRDDTGVCPCPSVTPCNGTSCVQSGPPLSSVDTGLNACKTQQGTAFACGGQTLHTVTYDCVLAPCCFEIPACVCASCNQDGTYLECH